ncbi:hypothetical protein C730_06275 [Helicobacter pylori Rif2]|uniref:Uncharacterized protein n=1 Tax=Helicobacter pylori TaxID=210 RepID=A0AAN1MX11_HELPX|nr:hypothetical protein C730_06275 [Helicobacter pylori Rif2]AUV75353.1 hypothetical protein C2841_06295 [Helicobacter pylori]AUV76835.1 hypothetical protein C2843_06275 [Helicobacter pylori]AUV78335.1 hypothetical protein C2840_06290 [Helicobacter pylori]AUV79844.1 hypothetical protein C2842_06285 [Helicobacter pylori]
MKGLKERAFYSINFLLHLKECEFRYNDKKNLHQVLLEWVRKNLLMLIQIYSNRRLYHAGFVL